MRRLIPVLLLWAAAGALAQNVCIISNNLFFAGDVVTSNCSASFNVSLCSLRTSVTNLEITTGALSASVTTLQGQMAVAQGNLTTLRTDVNALQGIGANVTILQGNVTTLDTRLTNAEVALSAVEASVTTLQGQMTGVQANVTILQGNVTTLRTDLTSVQTDVATLQTSVSILQTNVTTLASSISTINGQITSLSSQISSLQTTLFNRLKMGLVIANATAVPVDPSSPSTYSALTSLTEVTSTDNAQYRIPYFPPITGSDGAFQTVALAFYRFSFSAIVALDPTVKNLTAGQVALISVAVTLPPSGGPSPISTEVQRFIVLPNNDPFINYYPVTFTYTVALNTGKNVWVSFSMAGGDGANTGWTLTVDKIQYTAEYLQDYTGVPP